MRATTSRVVVLATALALCAVGCIGKTPDDEARAALGPDRRAFGPLHRAGTPCLLCHSERGGDEPYFSIAGTVYEIDGVTGAADARVTLVDAWDQSEVVTTNEVGNFMVTVDEWSPTFPLQATVEKDGTIVEMRSPISIEGSCAVCHRPTPRRDTADPPALSATTVGPVEVGEFPP